MAHKMWDAVIYFIRDLKIPLRCLKKMLVAMCVCVCVCVCVSVCVIFITHTHVHVCV
jgi:hypothetical protein